jgi:hypothetical protein
MRILIVLFLSIAFNHLFAQVKNPKDDGRKIKIPVVFHVLYRNNIENVSDSLIMNELKDLNLDFSAGNNMDLLDNDFRNLVGNPNIEFVLLDTTINGNRIKGIQRISASNVRDRNALLINSTNCVNVFVAKQGNASDTFSDRIHLDYEDVGTHSHVLTHEMGHWLGLFHTFGQIGNSYWWNVLLGNHDDLIDDTPKQKKATATCYSITPDCPCPPKKIYYDGRKTMYNNFMDYNPCRCMFSIGQSVQMRNNIIERKKGLF